MKDPKQALKERIENDFVFHSLKDGQEDRYKAIRSKAKEFALLIVDSTPTSREQSVALTELEKVMFYANAAIARNE
jgi:hypothetical protein